MHNSKDNPPDNNDKPEPGREKSTITVGENTNKSEESLIRKL